MKMTNFEDNYRYILMKDTLGMKASNAVVGALKKVLVGGSASKTVNVLRGELLVAIPSGDSYPPKEEGQRDYCLERDPTTILRLLDEQCVTPLGPEDFSLLKAVESPFDRFRVFADENWLEWGEKVYVGNEAFVRLPGPNPTSAEWARVIIRHKGPVKGLPGTIFGVEIVEKQHRSKGSTDGIFQTHIFFRCEDNCGLFVSLEKLYFSPRSEGTQGEMQHKRSSFPGSGDIKQSYARVASQPHDSRHDKNLPAAGSVDPHRKVQPRFKKNDRVIVYDKDNIAYHGTVRWVGRKNRIGRDLGAIHVGIEMDVFVASTDVPGAKTGLTDVFGGKKNYSIVIAEMFVAPEEACARENKGQQQGRKTAVDPPIDIDMNDPVAMARNYGMTKRQFMAQQEKVLKEAETQKKKQESSQSKEMKEVKQALGESINVQSQHKLFEDIRDRGGRDGNLHSRKLESQSSLDKPGVRRQRSLQPPDHLYDEIPVKDGDTHRHIGHQGKSSSIAQGDGISQSFEHEGYSHPQGTIPANPRPGQQQHHHRHDDVIYVNQQYTGGGSYGYDPQHIPQQQPGYGMVAPQQYYADEAPHQPGRSTDHAVYYPGKSTDQVPYQPNPERGPPYDVYNQPVVGGDQHHHHGFEGGYLPNLPGRGRDPTSDPHLQPGFDRASASQDVRNEPGFEGDPASRAHVQPGSGGVCYDDPQKGRRGYVNVDELPTEPRSRRFIGERDHGQSQPAEQRQYPPAGQQPQVDQWQQQAPADQWQNPPARQHQPPADQWQNLPARQHQPPADQWQQPPVQPGVAASTIPPGQGSHMQPNPSLSVGSRIQVATKQTEEPFKYGVIRWIGEVPQIQGELAGIELDDYMEGCTDGLLVSTKQRFFSCDPGRGLYYPLVNLQPDVRFMDPGAIIGGDLENPLSDVPLKEPEDQFTEGRTEQIQRYIGDRKGIQGHQNSCYLDASVFGLFALTDAFDEMFLKGLSTDTADQNRKEIAELLWKGIVNPLRKNGIVRYESVMSLRNKLDELGKMEGIAHAEKDPEEFLNMLFKHTLKVDPFLTIRRPFGDEPEFFVQLFVEFSESVQLPTIGHLLHSMFTEQKLSFTKMPSKLLVQVPRFGRQFKTYEKIIPDLKLNVTDLTEEYLQALPKCFVCYGRAECFCPECANELQKKAYLCGECDKRFHLHPKRLNHQRHQNIGNLDTGSSLDLLSVICIETSHYVCFTKQPSDDPMSPHKWIFFDSMANRVYDRFNIPSVTECSEVLNKWVYPANGDRSMLRSTPPRELPEYVRRFTQDLYLCVYVNFDSVLYG